MTREYVKKLTDRELDDIITGRTKPGATHGERVAIWNAAMDEEARRDDDL